LTLAIPWGFDFDGMSSTTSLVTATNAALICAVISKGGGVGLGQKLVTKSASPLFHAPPNSTAFRFVDHS
jgi:hypothetical protein